MKLDQTAGNHEPETRYVQFRPRSLDDCWTKLKNSQRTSFIYRHHLPKYCGIT